MTRRTGPPLHLRGLFYKEADRSYNVAEHSQPCHQWYICVHGSVATQIDGRPTSLRPGQSILYHPGVRRAPRCQGRAPGYLLVMFSNHGLDLDGACDRVLDLPLAQLPLLHTLIAELRQPQGAESGAYQTALVTSLLIAQCRAVRRPRAAVPMNAAASAGLVARAERYIDAHLGERLTRAAIARAAGCSVPHLARLLRGSGVLARLRERRIARACRLLRDSDATISEIAVEVGFASFSHFSRAFRALVGLSPTDYRRRGGEWSSPR